MAVVVVVGVVLFANAVLLGVALAAKVGVLVARGGELDAPRLRFVGVFGVLLHFMNLRYIEGKTR